MVNLFQIDGDFVARNPAYSRDVGRYATVVRGTYHILNSREREAAWDEAFQVHWP